MAVDAIRPWKHGNVAFFVAAKEGRIFFGGASNCIFRVYVYYNLGN